MADVALRIETSGHGRPVVLTHGLGDTLETWDALTDRLRDRYAVTRWDLRGHGGSAAPEDPAAYSRAIGVADLRRVVEAAGPPVDLVGHSLGGHLSLALALDEPDLVRSLTMIASGPGYKDPASRERWNAYVDRRAETFPIPRVAAGLCYQPDDRVITRAGSLACPLLQIVGNRDGEFHAGITYLARVVAGSEVVMVDDAGHHVQRTHPDDVAAALAAHLDR